MIKRENLKLEELPLTRRSYSVPELLDLLENWLGRKNLSLTGMNLQTLPDRKWLLRAIRFADAEDELAVFGDRIYLGQMVKKDINPM